MRFPLILSLVSLLLSGCYTVSHQTTSDPIPELDTKGDVYKTEGETDPLIYGSAIGDKKAIMFYQDFSDQEMTMSTEEKAKLVLGDGKFQELFRKQSYGKLRIEVEHIHDWRRMPKTKDSYGTKSTEAHRDLFVDIFNLYPEIDLREYDYIMAIMPGKGNVAFGEREDIAIPYRGEKIKLALNTGSSNLYVLAHETGHLMGLPDLYTYGDLKPKNPTGPWDIMSSSGGSTGFLGWHRHKLKWLDNDRKTYLSEGTHNLELSSLDADSGLSMIVIPVDDAANPSKVFVIEVAQAIKLKNKQFSNPGGILIYSVDAKLATGKNSVVVYPKKHLKDEALFYPDDTFEHDDAPMNVSVLKDVSGVYSLEISVKDK